MFKAVVEVERFSVSKMFGIVGIFVNRVVPDLEVNGFVDANRVFVDLAGVSVQLMAEPTRRTKERRDQCQDVDERDDARGRRLDPKCRRVTRP